MVVKTILLGKNEKKTTDYDEEYKEETSKMKEDKEIIYNYET